MGKGLTVSRNLQRKQVPHLWRITHANLTEGNSKQCENHCRGSEAYRRARCDNTARRDL